MRTTSTLILLRMKANSCAISKFRSTLKWQRHNEPTSDCSNNKENTVFIAINYFSNNSIFCNSDTFRKWRNAMWSFFVISYRLESHSQEGIRNISQINRFGPSLLYFLDTIHFSSESLIPPSLHRSSTVPSPRCLVAALLLLPQPPFGPSLVSISFRFLCACIPIVRINIMVFQLPTSTLLSIPRSHLLSPNPTTSTTKTSWFAPAGSVQ